MTVYLLHLEQPFHHAQHYLGSTDNLEHRLHLHRIGQGSRMLCAVRDAGIKWRLVRTWEGGRAEEARLKRSKNGPRYCPLCTPAARGGSPGALAIGSGSPGRPRPEEPAYDDDVVGTAVAG